MRWVGWGDVCVGVAGGAEAAFRSADGAGGVWACAIMPEESCPTVSHCPSCSSAPRCPSPPAAVVQGVIMYPCILTYATFALLVVY